ncbi:heparinase II/III domain-containing protein [Singulisphaera acidiphila]|uniref:Heparinase II/III-like protein n=1 Tax=Singulisphaera acidiphila (strain ATCC BAA-1392 / DSM 18658 / VKM B-2454 / MOB10) TaxID=886293 RepID=L0DEN0_SINAD|nr:heparinase II/III family protein [Singulisphaera acidiphila]AGA27717.1 Heparinase II/III-like protein [Singulisphaera acidiphila DSM 18658]
MISLLPLIAILLATAQEVPVSAPVFPPPVSERDVARLLQATAFVRGLDESALVKLVPRQSGLNFVGCPNCDQGRQENQLDWSPEQIDEVSCRYCKHRYPSAQYPMNKAVTVRNPRGEPQRYPYWENAQGYRYFFAAKRDDQMREYLAARARDLALLSVATGEKAHARRAALLLDQFAQVFPGWCYHYDYPFRQKEIDDGNVPPAQFRRGYRTARWTWWAYSDIPTQLVETYDWIRPSGVLADLSRSRGVDVPQRIEHDLFRNAADQVMANREESSNMDPTAWHALVTAGRVIGEPRYIHEVTRKLRHLIQTRFYYDGFWYEGAPSYGAQTLGGLTNVLGLLHGYSDPANYKDADGTRFDNLDLARELPELERTRTALATLRLPNGRPVPVHDTWRTDRVRARSSRDTSTPYLLPALGHASLGGGTGAEQTQFHLTWSGGYGHAHADNLSLLLFSQGRELLSDLGYTHTRYRAWTLATAAHNTVVIDGKSQSFGSLNAPSDGSLQYFDAGDPHVQVVSVDGTRGYPGLAKTYRRTLIVVDAGEGRRYAADLFDVAGGRIHDYFLHGDADEPTTVALDLPCAPLANLLPPGFDWQPTRNEGETGRASEPDYAYGFLRNLKSAPAPADVALPLTFRPAASSGPALRVTLFPEAGSRLVVGENPAISRAGEDDAQLDQFMRSFIALRHESSEGHSRFATILEPYAKAAFIDSVERVANTGAAMVLKVRIGDRTDLIVCGADEPVSVAQGASHATFTGAVGVLSLRGERIEHAFALGKGGWTRGDDALQATGPQSLSLRAVEGDTLILSGPSENLPGAGEVVRVLTADDWVYPYTVVASERQGETVRLRVAEGPGFTFDAAAGKLHLTAFPQREHTGAVRLEWTTRASR